MHMLVSCFWSAESFPAIKGLPLRNQKNTRKDAALRGRGFHLEHCDGRHHSLQHHRKPPGAHFLQGFKNPAPEPFELSYLQLSDGRLSVRLHCDASSNGHIRPARLGLARRDNVYPSRHSFLSVLHRVGVLFGDAELREVPRARKSTEALENGHRPRRGLHGGISVASLCLLHHRLWTRLRYQVRPAVHGLRPWMERKTHSLRAVHRLGSRNLPVYRPRRAQHANSSAGTKSATTGRAHTSSLWKR